MAEELSIRITASGAAAVKGIGAVKGAVGGLGSAMGAPTRAAGGLVNALGKIGLASMGIQAVIGAAKGLGDVLGVSLASDVNESMNKVDVLFGKSAGVIKDFATTAADAFGMSKLEALNAAGAYGNLFRTMGLGSDASAKMSVQLLKTAADLGSFNNVGTEEVLEKIRAGLIGESEPLRSLGININETAVQAKGFAMGLGHMEKKGKKWIRVLSDSDKLTARAALIMEQATVAANDFANTHAGMANAQKRINAGWENMKLAIGDKLLPVLAPLIADFADFMPKALDKVAPLIEAFGRTVGDIGKLIKGEITLGQYGEKVKAAIQTALNTAWAGVSSLAFDLWGKLTGGTTWTVGADGKAITATQATIEQGLATIWGKVTLAAVNLWDKIKVTATGLAEKLPGIYTTVTTWLGEQWSKIEWGKVWAAVTGVATDIGTRLGSIATTVTTWLGEQWGKVNWGQVWETAKTAIGSALVTAGDIASNVLTWIKWQWMAIDWSAVWGTVKEAAGKALTTALDIGGKALEWAKGIWGSIAWADVWGTVTGIGQGFIDAAIDISGKLTEWLKQQAGLVDWSKVWNEAKGPESIKGGIGWLWDWLVEAGKAVAAWVSNIPQTISDAGKAISKSSLLTDLGANIVNTILGGMGAGTEADKKGINAMAEGLVGQTVDSLNFVIAGQNFGSGVTKWAQTFDAKVFDAIATNVTGKPSTIAVDAVNDAVMIPLIAKSSNPNPDGPSGIGTNYVGGITDGITAALPDLEQAARNVALQLLSQTRGTLGAKSPSVEMYNTGVDTVQGLINGINAYRGNAANAGIGVGQAISNGMAVGILRGQSYVIAMAVQTALRAALAAKRALGIASPSKVFEGIGQQMMAGMAQGINRTAPAVASASRNAAQTAATTTEYHLHLNGTHTNSVRGEFETMQLLWGRS